MIATSSWADILLEKMTPNHTPGVAARPLLGRTAMPRRSQVPFLSLFTDA